MTSPNNSSSYTTNPVGAQPVSGDYRLLFFSLLLRRRIRLLPSGGKNGRLTDLIFRLADPYPEAVGIYIEHGRGLPSEFIPWEKVERIDDKAIFVKPSDTGGPYPKFVDQPGWLMVNEHLMGKTIFDMDGRRTEVVNDVQLLVSSKRMLLVHIDTSFNGFLRKWRIGWAKGIKDNLISWKYVQPLSVEEAQTKDAVTLSINREQLKELPGEDLADALEEIGKDEQQALLSALDSEKAAEALMETEARAQRQIIANLRKEKARSILQELSVPQLATLFSVLPHDEMNKMLELLPAETTKKTRELMEQEETTAKSFVSNECVTVNKSLNIEDALRTVRLASKPPAALSYIYVVNDQHQLVGVIDIRELVASRDDVKIEDIMISPVLSADDVDTREDLEAMFEKYQYRTIPIVDTKDHFLGVAYQNEIMKGG